MITDLEPDILESEVKWVLGSITTNKATGGDGIPAELFQVLKDDAALNMQFDLLSLSFSKGSLNIWKFMVHVSLKPGLENFEHYFTCV